MKLIATVPFYHPQTKFAKVMFLHQSVILFTGGGCLGPGPGGYRPRPRGGGLSAQGVVQAQAQGGSRSGGVYPSIH